MEVTITYCDKCNIEQEKTKMFKVSPEWCAILGLEQDKKNGGAFALRGVFSGTFADAQKYDEWVEADYGHCCPICAFEEKQLEDGGESVVLDKVEALALVKG